MVGLNDVFTVVGFKFETKKKKQASTRSQRVEDYTAMVLEVEKDLNDSPKALAFYQALTPGYRKGWARYVYSAVQEETRAKRRVEMIELLSEGYKSIDLYRRNE